MVIDRLNRWLLSDVYGCDAPYKPITKSVDVAVGPSMAIRIFFAGQTSELGIRIAALIVTQHRLPLQTLSNNLRQEVEQIIEWLESLPDCLGSVLAWEALCKNSQW